MISAISHLPTIQKLPDVPMEKLGEIAAKRLSQEVFDFSETVA